jgi:transposase
MVSQEVVQKILELRRQGLSIREIAKRVGLSHSTVWYILKKHEQQLQQQSGSGSSKQVQNVQQTSKTVQEVQPQLNVQILVQGLAELVKALENSVLDLSKRVERLELFKILIEHVSRVRVEGPTKCKYIDDYGYCEKIVLPQCPPDFQCIEVILADGRKMYRPRVVDNPVLCAVCPYYKPKKLI